MKVRHIKKLRKVVANFKEYEVSHSLGLFGDFDGGGLCSKNIMAITPRMAVEKYQRWYFRHYKHHNKFHTTYIVETTWNWGKFMVVDSKGYSRYFM